MAQTIEGMCKRGRLDYEIDLEVCGEHEENELRETSKDVKTVLNTASKSPASKFAGLVLRGKHYQFLLYEHNELTFGRWTMHRTSWRGQTRPQIQGREVQAWHLVVVSPPGLGN